MQQQPKKSHTQTHFKNRTKKLYKSGIQIIRDKKNDLKQKQKKNKTLKTEQNKTNEKKEEEEKKLTYANLQEKEQIGVNIFDVRNENQTN